MTWFRSRAVIFRKDRRKRFSKRFDAGFMRREKEKKVLYRVPYDERLKTRLKTTPRLSSYPTDKTTKPDNVILFCGHTALGFFYTVDFFIIGVLLALSSRWDHIVGSHHAAGE